MQLESVLGLIDHLGLGPQQPQGVGGGFVKTAGVHQTAFDAGVALGVTKGLGPGDFRLAVRVYRQGPNTRFFLNTIDLAVGGEAQIQIVGPLAGPRSTAPVYQKKHGVLLPGLSIAHFQDSAGTIGGFVQQVDDPSLVHILSNNHVLARSNSLINPSTSSLGDAVVHPGPVDGGSAPGDWVADLSYMVQLARVGNLVDGALAKVERPYECSYAGRRLRGIADPVQGQKVWKVGRTTGVTTGTIGATDIRFTGIEYPFGMAFFDGVFEVQGDGSAFSGGGDSGSLVLNEDYEAVGLLFAGKDSDQTDPTGYTLVIPIRTVLATMQVTLLM